MTRNRRTFLRTVAAAGSTALLGASAGCTDLLSLGSSPSYSSWLYEPGAIANSNHYSFRVGNPKRTANHRDQFDIVPLYHEPRILEPFSGAQVLDISEVDTAVLLEYGAVFEGTFDADTFVNALTGSGYERQGRAYGFEHYTDGPVGFGVRDGTIIGIDLGVFSEDDPAVPLTVLAATDAGDRQRYQETDADMAALIEHLDDGYFHHCGILRATNRSLDGQVGFGIRCAFADDPAETAVRKVYLFEDESSVDLEAAKKAGPLAETGIHTIHGLKNVSVTRAGRAAIVEARAPTDRLII